MEQSRDRQIRAKVQEKDQDFQQELKGQMAKEEEMLSSYFKQFKKPIGSDPKKVKRDQSIAADRSLVFKQALRPFQLFHTFYEFWNMQCATPQQNYTLNLCKKNMLKNMAKGTAASLLLTSLISFRYRSSFSKGMHLLGIGTSLMSGLLYGAIVSTQFTLDKFEKLGQAYELGRNASYEIERYRMDQNQPKS